jgi:hypothetical protein
MLQNISKPLPDYTISLLRRQYSSDNFIKTRRYAYYHGLHQVISFFSSIQIYFYKNPMGVQMHGFPLPPPRAWMCACACRKKHEKPNNNSMFDNVNCSRYISHIRCLESWVSTYFLINGFH